MSTPTLQNPTIDLPKIDPHLGSLGDDNTEAPIPWGWCTKVKGVTLELCI